LHGLEYEFFCSTFLIWRKPENKKIFWPSSIVAFNLITPKEKTPHKYTTLWNLFNGFITESVNKQVKGGASINIISLRREVFVILV
jgi:hypothetical protein